MFIIDSSLYHNFYFKSIEDLIYYLFSKYEIEQNIITSLKIEKNKRHNNLYTCDFKVSTFIGSNFPKINDEHKYVIRKISEYLVYEER